MNQTKTDFIETISVRKYVLIGLAVWTVFMAGLLVWNNYKRTEFSIALALNTAHTVFGKDQALRKWVTAHGGVYVQTTKETPPNPYLSHVPERDITTPSGRALTLMNPAYTLRQMMEEYQEEYGIRGHITSLKPLNPLNVADEWETKVLKKFEKGVEEVWEITDIKDEPYLRLMHPMVTAQGCLKCHAEQGYKVGDIRGGLTVSVPMESYFTVDHKVFDRNAVVYGLVYILGLMAILGLGWTGNQWVKEIRVRRQAEVARNAASLSTVKAVASTIEKKDPYTSGHQDRVTELAVAIGKEMGLAEDRVEGLQLGSLIHDIGKIYVPAEILNRPGEITDAEFEIIKTHPTVGYDIMEGVKFPWPIQKMIVQHHERLDGKGYPNGLMGEEIILEAQIIAVADVVEAVTARRPYREALGMEAALEVIREGIGTHFREDVACACLKVIEEKGFTWDKKP